MRQSQGENNYTSYEMFSLSELVDLAVCSATQVQTNEDITVPRLFLCEMNGEDLVTGSCHYSNISW